MGWLSGSQAVGQVITIGAKLLLARLMTTADFGTVAVAVAFTSFAQLFVELGFGDAVLQRKAAEFGERERSTAFWANMMIGLLLCPISIAAAPWLAILFDAPEVGPVLQLLSISFVLLAPQALLRALFTRKMNYRVVGLASVTGAVLGGVVGVVLALMGWGVWALVALNLVRSTSVTLAMFVAARWVPRQFIHLPTLRSLWSFGMYMTGVRVLNNVTRNGDTMLVALLLGQSAAGIYSVAYQGVILPVTYISRPIGSVVYSALCRMEDDSVRRAVAFSKTLEVLIVLGFPMGFLGMMTADVVLPVLLGPQWTEAAPVFAVLAVSGGVQTMLQTSTSILQAANRPGISLAIQIVKLVLVMGGVLAGIPFGPFGVGVGYTIAWLILVPVHLAPVVVWGKVPREGIVRPIAQGCLNLVFTVGAFGLISLVPAGPDAARVLLGAAIATAVWLVASYLSMPSFRDLTLLLRKRVGRRFGRASA
ncbi:MAG: lipopolysaccharide biosynthesis protein [Myxococcota bacterium]